MNLLYRLASAGMLMILAACSAEEAVESMADKFATDQAREKVETIAELVLSRDAEGLRAQFSSLNLDESFDEQLTHMLSFVPEGEVKSRVFANFKFNTRTGTDGSKSTYDFQYQYLVGSEWMWLQIVVQEQGDNLLVSNVKVTPLNDDLRNQHKFDLFDAAVGKIFFVLAMILSPIFIVFTFVTAFRMRKQLLKPKRWLLFILIGISVFELNWTTSAWQFQPLHFGLLGAGFVKSGLIAPWVLSLYPPVGALMFWFYKKTGKLGLKEELQHAGTDATAAG